MQHLCEIYKNNTFQIQYTDQNITIECEVNYTKAYFECKNIYHNIILVDRYENERLIINTHIDNIMKLPSVVTENTIQLRQIVDTTKCNQEALKAMNLHTETWDLMIINI